MYILLFWNNDFDQKVKNNNLFFALVIARIRGKRTRAKDQKQTIYFKRPNHEIFLFVNISCYTQYKLLSPAWSMIMVTGKYFPLLCYLRLPDTYEVKIAKMCARSSRCPPSR